MILAIHAEGAVHEVRRAEDVGNVAAALQSVARRSDRPRRPLDEILVWKFTRKREHAVAFKSMLRRRGIRVTSITEHADDSPTGKLMEAIIESVDEFYSENLAQDVVRSMREAASRGFFLGSRAPFRYRRIKVSDGVRERPTGSTCAPRCRFALHRSESDQSVRRRRREAHQELLIQPCRRHFPSLAGRHRNQPRMGSSPGDARSQR